MMLQQLGKIGEDPVAIVVHLLIVGDHSQFYLFDCCLETDSTFITINIYINALMILFQVKKVQI